jgi:hypothetical protein
MKPRYCPLLICLLLLPFGAFAQRRLSVGPVVAFGTSGIQEPIRLEASENFAAGNRLSRAVKLGAFAQWSFGGGSALVGEAAWFDSRTKFVSQFRFFPLPARPTVQTSTSWVRIEGWQLNLLFRQHLLSERRIRPVCEAGLGIVFPTRTHIRSEDSSAGPEEWREFAPDQLRSHQWLPQFGFGIQYADRLTLTLRLAVVTGSIFREPRFRCFDFCPPVADMTRPGIGLNTQLVHLSYLL